MREESHDEEQLAASLNAGSISDEPTGNRCAANAGAREPGITSNETDINSDDKCGISWLDEIGACSLYRLDH